MAAFLPVVLLSLLVTSATAGGYGSETTTSPSTPATYTPTPATPPPPTPTPPATPPKPVHDYDNDDDNKLVVVVVRVVVEGLVLCQSCMKRGGAAPLPKAHVMVTCRDGKHQVMAVADSNGYFHVEFTVERADDFWTKDPRGACFVRLLKSPEPKCNMVSDIHLRDEVKHWTDGRGFRNVIYDARRLVFRARTCARKH